jgi:hypothetical protein
MIALLNIKSLTLSAWGLVNAVLLVGIGSELGWGEGLRQPLPMPEQLPSLPVAVELHPDFQLPLREKAFQQSLERPLFVPSRRKAPPPPPPPPPPRPTMQKGQFQLLGTIITDEANIAVVREIASGKERQVYQGYTVNGLLLEVVEANRIVFTQYDEREEIGLKIQPSPKAAAKAKPAAAGGQAPASQAAPATLPQTVRPSSRVEARGGAAAREVPERVPLPPQTMEDRKADPMMKDFFK